MLFDRDGRVLVENRYAFNISLVREQTKDLDRTLSTLARVTGADPSNSEEIVDRHAREPRYRPVLLIADASLAQVSAVLARRLELPDVMVEQVPTRQYPTDEMAAHLFGYVGEITEAPAGSRRALGPARRDDHRPVRGRAGVQPRADGQRRCAARRREQPRARDRGRSASGLPTRASA